MAKVSIIGAGTTGLVLAYACLRDGHDVTLYSDRTADEWLNCKPTGTAYLYGETIDVERELGMDHWSHEMFGGMGVLLDFKPELAGEARMRVSGNWGSLGSGIDMRMRVHRWMNDLKSRGGKLVIEAVTPERADEIAQASDVTLLAAGKADLGNLIPRNAERSVYDKPQRNLAMAVVTGVTGWREEAGGFEPVKFNFFGDTGEYFWVPFTHKTHGPTWCVLWEAKAGKAFDRFGDCKSGEDIVEVTKQLIQEYAPWEWENVKDMEYVAGDDSAWLVGRFPPTVREAYGRLPSGSLIMPVGDTAIAFDPIGGQGGNNAQRMAKFVADRITARGDKPFDADWMTEVNDDWWYFHGKWAYEFNNLLLEPLEPAAGMLLEECAKNRVFADQKFFSNFPRPHNFFPAIVDADKARELIEQAHVRA